MHHLVADDLACHNNDNLLDSDLLSAIAGLVGLDAKDIETQSDSTFIELGGSSAKALELTFRLDAVGKAVDIETILDEQSTIKVLSQILAQHSGVTSESSSESESETENASTTPRSVNTDPLEQISSLLPQHIDSTSVLKEVSKQIGCRNDQIEAIRPLTNQQKALWLGSLKAQGSYVSHWCYRLPDDVDLRRLYNAWDGVLQIAPVLRTRVVLLSDDILCQAVLKYTYYDHHQQSVEGLLRNQRSAMTDHGSSLFEFAVETREKARRLHIFAHHVIYDRWSIRLIFQDVKNAYYTQKAPCPRPPYEPFLRPLKQDQLTELRKQWHAAIGEVPITSAPLLKCPESSTHASKLLQLSTQSLQPSRFTKAELIAAAWSLVCSRHCNSARISFGMTLWGRDLSIPGVRDMAFPTFNTLPFCTQISEDETVGALLSKVKSNLSFLRRMQRLNVEEISGLGPIYRETCRFNSILVIQQEDVQQLEAERSLFDVQTLLSFESTQSDPIVLECTPAQNETTIKMRYDPAYISTIEAETMLSHLKTALETLSDTDEKVSRISLFNERDLRQVTSWVKSSTPCRSETLHSLIEQQAIRRPNSTAIWQTDISLTYQDLINYSRKVMARIIASNNEESPNIGVCFEKSAFAVVSMLGISVSGYCFVPMDASNPFKRLMQLVTDAEIQLVLCSRVMAPRFREANVQTIIIDEESLSEMLNPEDDDPPPVPDTKDHVYIIYTSGSTGQPKGVVMTHESLCTELDALTKVLEFSEDTRSLQFSSFAFDMSMHDIWCTLKEGGVLCIPTETERLELDDFLPRAKCNYGMLTSSIASTLSNKSWRSFERISLGGEPLSKAVLCSALDNDVKVWNCYGPTESCIACLAEQIKAKNTSPLRLGYSVAATVWILDANNPHALAPVGCIGEVAVTGHTLAEGYYRDSEKTKKAFVEGLEWTKMFPDLPLERVYRTGDLAKYNGDGSLEFIGRMGGYVKIAGNRVDLGEIEFVLQSQCGLPRVSVQYCKTGTTHSRELLVGFCAIPSDKKSENPELLSMTEEMKTKATEGFTKLSDLLPRYMIPVALIPISKFPYTTAEKLDVKSLINMIVSEDGADIIQRYGIDTQEKDSLDLILAEEEEDEEGEFSSSALLLRDSWATVLKLASSSISRKSHFFKLGGDSLRAMNLSTQVRKSGHLLRVSDVFRYPVLNDMACQVQTTDPKYIRRGSGGRDAISRPFWGAGEHQGIRKAACDNLRIREDQIESLLPCSPLQVQMLVASAQSQGSYMHIECFKLRTGIQLDEVKAVCQSLVDSHGILRSKAFIDAQSGQFVLVILQPHVALELKRERSSPQAFAQSPQRVALGIDTDLCRFSILEHDQDQYLVWEMHHSIYDGYSHILLIQRLRAAIEQCRKHSSSAKSTEHESTARFEDFVKYIDHADKQEGRDFWSTYLQGATKFNLSPTRSESSPTTTDARITRNVGIKWKKSEFTTATYIRAAFALTLSQLASTADVLFSATNNGRDLPVTDIEEIVGPTFSTLPVRCRIDQDELLNDMLSRIQLDAAEVASHQYMSPQEISSINDSCKQACQFDIHLLVQSANSEPPYRDLEYLGYERLPELSPMSLQIPFNLVATAKADCIHLEVIYDNDRYTSEQVCLLLDRFMEFLTQILAATEHMTVGSTGNPGQQNKSMLFSMQPSDEQADKIESILENSDLDIQGVVAGTYAVDGGEQEIALYFVRSTRPETLSSDVQILPLQKDDPRTISRLKEILENELPRSLVPDVYIPISAIPRTTLDKKDREQLQYFASLLHPSQIDLFRPASERSQRSRHGFESVPRSRSPFSSTSTETETKLQASRPLTSTEITLLNLWSEVLDLPPSTLPLTCTSHFTKLGGNYVSAIRLSDLARSSGIELPVAFIYQGGTLGEMAKLVDEAGLGTGVPIEVVTPAPFELAEHIEISPMMERGERKDYFEDTGT